MIHTHTHTHTLILYIHETPNFSLIFKFKLYGLPACKSFQIVINLKKYFQYIIEEYLQIIGLMQFKPVFFKS